MNVAVRVQGSDGSSIQLPLHKWLENGKDKEGTGMFATVEPGTRDNMFLYTAGSDGGEARQWLRDECKELTQMMSTEEFTEKKLDMICC